jgi:hypothetical protein
MHQKSGSPGFITSTRSRRSLPTASDTMKLEKETHEKMRKLAEIRSTVAAERQVTEELRREVSTKGWCSLNPMPPSNDKAMKPTRSPLLQQPPPSNFKIKRSSSSTFKSPDAYLNENKFAKLGPPQGHLQTYNHGCSPDVDTEEEAHCTSAVEALKEWHNSSGINHADVQQNKSKPQQQFQPELVTISCWEPSNENHGTCRPMEIDTIPEEQPERTWSTMNTQTEKPRGLTEVEPDHPTTIEGTYFQHLCNQDYRKVQA